MVRKSILAMVIAVFSASVFAQKVEEATLVVSGEASNKQDATALALRSAIEQTFGVFVSANTQILNDELVKDEIATVSSGNIKAYTEIAAATLPNGNTMVTLEAVVSISKLVSYAQSKGSSAEFAGATFGMNMKLRELNKANEEKAIEHMISQFIPMLPTLYDFELRLGEPRLPEYNSSAVYEIPGTVFAKPTQNLKVLKEILDKTLATLCLSPQDIKDYEYANMPSYRYPVYREIAKPTYYVFRSDLSYDLMKEFFGNSMASAIMDFQIEDNLGGKSSVSPNFGYMGLTTNDQSSGLSGLLTSISLYYSTDFRYSYFHFGNDGYRMYIRLHIPQKDISKYTNFTITHKTKK